MATRKTMGDVVFYLNRVNKELKRLGTNISYNVRQSCGVKFMDMYQDNNLCDTIGKAHTTDELYYILLTLYETLYHVS